MIVVPSSSWTLEWGLCLVTLGFCWRYRGTSAANAVRQLFKKLEVFLLPSTSSRTPCGECVNQREEKYLHGIPNTKSDLNPRRYGRKPDHLKKPVKDLNFYRTLQNELNSKEDVENKPVLCSVCCHSPKKGLHRQPRKISTDLKNVLECDTRLPHNPWYVRLCAYFVFWWRKRFIGEQYSMVKLKAMMSDKKVNKAIEQAAKMELHPKAPEGTYEKLLHKHTQRTKQIVAGMRAKQAANPWFSTYVRIASWVIGKTLGRIYPQILVRKSQIETIRKAREMGNPIVYLPVHRSHVDYVLVSWVLVACDIRAPLVAAGDNLNIPIFSLLMRSVGGFFIKRRLDVREGKRDIVYRAILHSYMTRTLTDDNDLEFFIEGGRTRTGKPCLPKGGLLSIVVDALMNKKVEDALIVPVNFSYERLLDGNFIREQLGRPKVSESFASAAMGLWNSLQAKFGSARIDFGEPFSLRNYVHAHQVGSPSPLSYPQLHCNNNNYGEFEKSQELAEVKHVMMYPPDSEEHRQLVNNLGKHVIYDGQKCFSMMTTHAIAFLLLNKYRKGVTTEELSKEIEALIQEMLDRGYDVGISESKDERLVHGLTVLGQALVRQEVKPSVHGPTITVKPVTILPNIIELAYYSNCLLPVYSMEAVLATSVSILAKENLAETDSLRFDEKAVLGVCFEICEILQHEFVFAPPCTKLEDALRSTIDYLCETNVFVKEESQEGTFICVNSTSSMERVKFLTNLIQPIVHTYYHSACVLKRTIGFETQEKQLQMDILAEIKTLLEKDAIPFGESLSVDPIRNFIKLMLGWDVLDSYKYDRATMYYLHDHFDCDDQMEEVVQRINRFRLV